MQHKKMPWWVSIDQGTTKAPPNLGDALGQGFPKAFATRASPRLGPKVKPRTKPWWGLGVL